jgi:hypothetical protein
LCFFSKIIIDFLLLQAAPVYTCKAILLAPQLCYPTATIVGVNAASGVMIVFEVAGSNPIFDVN